ncbi:hypothetical protein V6x_59840 [Gimesia chilikensis]|uniref:ORC1/DEAH AAA+ ATPase domain-containing protein n=1 Tax=Gimesia chilikensis TaxID=2605989 RepID=A0A517WLU2_9PLAN|nr:serine protease [Gimesia chilikensis]QDU06232.1 hypothetical protein V6x_59840 [Gimesia chilikensis]
MLFDESQIDRSLARVCNSEGTTLGTAFFIHPNGTALTCHHVIESVDTVSLECGDGTHRTGTILASERYQEIDVALIRCSDGSPIHALPVEVDHSDIKRFWTKGYQFDGLGITDAIPASGLINGTTSVRFETNHSVYQLDGVMALKNDAFDSGISGAPVFDPDTGVVIGLVNAEFSADGPLAGFALPISQVSQHTPELADLIASNQATIERYGRYLNQPGGRKICKRQSQSTLDRLIRHQLYLNHEFCERQALTTSIDKFLAGTTTVFPLFGSAGVGKTTALSHLVETRDDLPIVFLLARDMGADETDLHAALNRRLKKSAPRELGPQDCASRLAKAVQSDKGHLVVILDGLNELPPALLSGLESWIEQSIDWLIETNSRLIVSCRIEFWNNIKNLFPKTLIFYDNPDNPSPGFELDEFTDEESQRARDAYQLDDSLLTRHIRHPLMARIHWELQSENPDAPVAATSQNAALNRFIDQKYAKIARAFPGTVVKSFVEAELRRVVQASLEHDGFTIDRATFFNLFADDHAIANQLILEGLFIETREGFRFSFDEIGEFLQAQLLTVSDLEKAFRDHHRESHQLTAGTIQFTLLRLEQEDTQKFQEGLRILIASYDHDEFRSSQVMAQLLPQIQNPISVYDLIEQYVNHMKIKDSYYRIDDAFSIRRSISRMDLPTSQKLKLLRGFLPGLDSYDFEPHHWDDLNYYVFKESDNPATLIGNEIQSDPIESFDVLIDWLDDTTNLRNKNSTVGHVAMALMFYHRHLEFARLCDRLAESTHDRAAYLLRIISKSDTEKILTLCLRWVTESEQKKKSAAQLAHYIASQLPNSEYHERIHEMLSSLLERTTDKSIRITAMLTLAEIDQYRDAVIDELLQLFRNRDPLLTGYELTTWMRTHFNQILTAVSENIQNGNYQNQCAGDLYDVCRFEGTAEQKEKLIELWYSSYMNQIGNDSTMGFALEALLSNVDSQATMTQILKILEEPLDHFSKQIRRSLIISATNHRAKNRYRAELQHRILEQLVEEENDSDNQVLLLERIITQTNDRDNELKYVISILNRMDRCLFQKSLLKLVWIHKHIGARLVKWLESEPLLPPEGSLADFLKLVHSGDTPRNAAERIIFND